MTVGELIAELEKYPRDQQLVSTGADSGGYDAIYTKDIVVKPHNKKNSPLLYVGGEDEEE